jgi:hypothetical protein
MIRRAAIALAALLLLLGAVLGAFHLLSGGPSDPISRAADPFRYDLTAWEFRHVLNRWLYEIGHLFDEGDSIEEENAKIQRYFSLAAEVESLRRQVVHGGDEALRPTLDRRRQEQRRLENKVEAILEKRVSSVIEDQGLTKSLPLFSSIRFVFPPLDFEFDRPPRVLAASPRDRISLDKSILLRPGMTAEEVARLEEQTAATGMSTVVLTVGGVATYPSAIPDHRSYEVTLETVAHEWLHQYLFFHPLGRDYFRSNTLRTLNETVANIAARDIARLVQQRYPLPESEPAQHNGPDQTKPSIDFRKEMHELRLEVDRLLEEGKVHDAEALMEEKRQFLAENGFYIRKINQAYFAFNGLYADTPASSDPIGDKMTALRDLSPSVGEFVHTVSGITSEEDLDRLLAEKGAEPSTPP